MTFLQEYRRERALIDAKIRAAGIDPASIILRARVRNWLQDVKHTIKNMVLYYRTGLIETTTATDVYATYDYERHTH
jgi:hypothetical protein